MTTWLKVIATEYLQFTCNYMVARHYCQILCDLTDCIYIHPTFAKFRRLRAILPVVRQDYNYSASAIFRLCVRYFVQSSDCASNMIVRLSRSYYAVYMRSCRLHERQWYAALQVENSPDPTQIGEGYVRVGVCNACAPMLVLPAPRMGAGRVLARPF